MKNALSTTAIAAPEGSQAEPLMFPVNAIPMKHPKIDQEVSVGDGQTILIKSSCGEKCFTVTYCGQKQSWFIDGDPFGPFEKAVMEIQAYDPNKP